MKFTAKSASKQDVRDACGALSLSVQTAGDLNILTRLYRCLAGIESDPETDAAIEVLSRPIERFTRGESNVTMTGRDAEWKSEREQG